MKTYINKLLLYFFVAVIPITSFCQVSDNQNSTDTLPFQYGANPGYYGNGWFDTDLADIAANAGSHSFRATLPDHFVQTWGYDIRLDVFKYYKDNLGMKGISLFIGEPSDTHVDKTTYTPATEHSSVFANLYTPIWDDGSNGTPVNDNNYFAVYVYNLVIRYGKFIQYWEIVNEPDFSYFWDNGNRNNANNWFNNSPSPKDLPNLKAPIYSYIRMLRIANNVIKRYEPDAYIAPGGLGYPAFLDALLRFTDNPDSGKVTSTYPLKGGSYFDVVSIHNYPANNLSQWDNSIGGFRWFRHSDRAAEETYLLKNNFNDVLLNHGYNGIINPKKPFILTEVNIPRKMFGNHYGGDEAQRNFIIKSAIYAQKNEVQQFYIYKVGEGADYNTATNAFDLMGLYENLTRDKKGSEKLTSEGKALKTTSMLLYGWRYDPVRTLALTLPNNVGGAAFKLGEDYRYVLWAKTTTDLSEAASGTYTFPSSLGIDSLSRYEWDYSVNSGAKSKGRSQNISLSGTPSFFEQISHEFIVLPVSIVSLNAKVNDCKVAIDWIVTFSDPGNKIIIEESKNGEDFIQIYSAELSKNNKIGSIQHVITDSGKKMYRLVIEKANKTKIYSQIKTIVSNCNKVSVHIMARPNPARNFIIVSGLSNDQLICIYDSFGRKKRIQKVNTESEKIDLTNFASSYYYLKITNSKGDKLKTIKFLKN